MQFKDSGAVIRSKENRIVIRKILNQFKQDSRLIAKLSAKKINTTKKLIKENVDQYAKEAEI
jgi:hypothetical protein